MGLNLPSAWAVLLLFFANALLVRGFEQNPFEPVADPSAQVTFPRARFTLLTSALVRSLSLHCLTSSYEDLDISNVLGFIGRWRCPSSYSLSLERKSKSLWLNLETLTFPVVFLTPFISY